MFIVVGMVSTCHCVTTHHDGCLLQELSCSLAVWNQTVSTSLPGLSFPLLWGAMATKLKPESIFFFFCLFCFVFVFLFFSLTFVGPPSLVRPEELVFLLLSIAWFVICDCLILIFFFTSCVSQYLEIICSIGYVFNCVRFSAYLLIHRQIEMVTKIGTENVPLSRDVVVMQRELMTFEKAKPR